MARLFTGIQLPDDVRDQISDLAQPIPGVRWIDDDDLHLTLRFVGDVDNRIADEFALLAGDTRHIRMFEMRLNGLSTFGGRGPRLLWAGVEAGLELLSLARAHERAACGAGLPALRRSFHPHVTIARLSYPRIEALARFLAGNGSFRSVPFLVSHATLFSAKPLTGGGPYVVEDEFPLAGALATSGELFDPDIA